MTGCSGGGAISGVVTGAVTTISIIGGYFNSFNGLNIFGNQLSFNDNNTIWDKIRCSIGRAIIILSINKCG